MEKKEIIPKLHVSLGYLVYVYGLWAWRTTSGRRSQSTDIYTYFGIIGYVCPELGYVIHIHIFFFYIPYMWLCGGWIYCWGCCLCKMEIEMEIVGEGNEGPQKKKKKTLQCLNWEKRINKREYDSEWAANKEIWIWILLLTLIFEFVHLLCECWKILVFYYVYVLSVRWKWNGMQHGVRLWNKLYKIELAIFYSQNPVS